MQGISWGTLPPSLITLGVGFALGWWGRQQAQWSRANYDRWQRQVDEAKATLPKLRA